MFFVESLSEKSYLKTAKNEKKERRIVVILRSFRLFDFSILR